MIVIAEDGQGGAIRGQRGERAAGDVEAVCVGGPLVWPAVGTVFDVVTRQGDEIGLLLQGQLDDAVQPLTVDPLPQVKVADLGQPDAAKGGVETGQFQGEVLDLDPVHLHLGAVPVPKNSKRGGWNDKGADDFEEVSAGKFFVHAIKINAARRFLDNLVRDLITCLMKLKERMSLLMVFYNSDVSEMYPRIAICLKNSLRSSSWHSF